MRLIPASIGVTRRVGRIPVTDRRVIARHKATLRVGIRRAAVDVEAGTVSVNQARTEVPGNGPVPGPPKSHESDSP